MAIIPVDDFLSTGPKPQAPKPKAGSDVQADYDNLLAGFPGAQVTSRTRSPERNRRVGGVANSQHLTGTAMDVVIGGADRQRLAKEGRARGYEVIDEGDHLHFELPPGGKKQRAASPNTPENVAAMAADLDRTIQELNGQPADTEQASGIISVDDFLGGGGGVATPAPKPTAPANKSTQIEAFRAQPDDHMNFPAYVGRSLSRTFEDNPETGMFDRLWNRLGTELGHYGPDDVRYSPSINTVGADPYAMENKVIRNKITEQEDAQREYDEHIPGFLNSLKSPLDLIYGESLPADISEAARRLPERSAQAVMNARKIAMQEQIVANPDSYPAVSVAEAKKAIAARKAKQDPTVAGAWNEFKKAAMTNPASMAGEFVNAFVADPELIFIPLGSGAKTLSSLKAAQGTGRVAKALRAAEAVGDPAVLGGATNAVMTEAENARAGRNTSSAELAFSTTIGAGIGGLFGTIFAKAATAKASIRAGKLTGDDVTNALRDAAAEDVVVEDLVNSLGPDEYSPIIYGPDGRPMPADVKTRIEHALGIEHLSPAERNRWHKNRQDELRKTFGDQWSEADYLKFKADERILRASQLAEEAGGRQARSAAEALRQEEVEAAYGLAASERAARMEAEYTAALKQRDEIVAQRENVTAHQQALEEHRLRAATARLDQEEIIAAAFEGDAAVEAAAVRALQRDQKLARPRKQRGEIDRKLLVYGATAAFFGLGAAAQVDEEDQLKAGLVFGLGGLTLAGLVSGKGIRGTVLGKLRQAGAISADGDIFALVKAGKMRFGREAGEIREREATVIARAKQGDQAAFKELYDENFKRVTRYMRQFARVTGEDAEDLAQEAMIKAFKNLDSFDGNSQFYTWLHKIAENHGKNAIKATQAQKEGGKFKFTSMYGDAASVGESARAGHIAEGEAPAVKGFVEAADHPDAFSSNQLDTPEARLEAEQTRQRWTQILKDLPEEQREAFILNRFEQYTAEEISQLTGTPLSTVLMRIKTARDTIITRAEKAFLAKKVAPAEPEVKRGRGRPRKQAGFVDQKLLVVGAVATLGAAAGAYLDRENRKLGAIWGAGWALGGLYVGSRTHPKGGTVAGKLVEHADYLTGITSTRIMNISKALWRRAIEHERVVLRDTHKYLTSVEPFLVRLSKQEKDIRDVLARAILTGKSEVTNRILAKLGDQELIANWKQVRSTLDSLGDQLVTLKRFSKKQLEYFPRIVKDVDGLLKALGQERGNFLDEALKAAEQKSISARGTGLTDLEKSLIINKVLREDAWKSQQPGFAKNRGVEEITPELQQFYATPAEALHSYIRAAVDDIERAKFFGEHLKVIPKGGSEYTNIDASIGELVNSMQNRKELTSDQAIEVAGMLRSRFLNGEKVPNFIMQGAKDLAYAGLLGNPVSAVTQLADSLIQAYTQDIRSATSAVVRRLTGNSIVRMRDFGLADTIGAEFVSTTKSRKFLEGAFKWGLFQWVDEFGKDVSLNAAILRAARQAKTEGGVAVLTKKWGKALGPKEMQQLVNDLQKGEPTDLVNSIAFAELSRTQPITRLELPQAYLDNPNGRVLYMFKTFMLKQIDVVRRDAYNEIKAGNVAKGIKNLTEFGIVLGVSGTATATIKDWILGRDVGFDKSDIAWNAAKTFALSQYTVDQAMGVDKREAAERRARGEKIYAQPAAPAQAAVSIILPPAKMFDEIARRDPKAWRYIPIVGPFIYEQVKGKKK